MSGGEFFFHCPVFFETVFGITSDMLRNHQTLAPRCSAMLAMYSKFSCASGRGTEAVRVVLLKLPDRACHWNGLTIWTDLRLIKNFSTCLGLSKQSQQIQQI